jgi:hypothetical protein
MNKDYVVEEEEEDEWTYRRCRKSRKREHIRTSGGK